MSRSTLPCPIKGCRTSINGYRPNQLVDHFKQEHSDLDGVTVNLPSDILWPSWQPFSPSSVIPPPPPLPAKVDPGCIVIEPTKPSVFRKELPSPFSSLSTASPPTSPRKQAPRQIPKGKEKAKDKDTDSMDLDLPEFEDIPSVDLLDDALFQFGDLVVWRRPQALVTDVSRPQSMRDFPVEEPPISMLYPRFARHVDELFPP